LFLNLTYERHPKKSKCWLIIDRNILIISDEQNLIIAQEEWSQHQEYCRLGRHWQGWAAYSLPSRDSDRVRDQDDAIDWVPHSWKAKDNCSPERISSNHLIGQEAWN